MDADMDDNLKNCYKKGHSLVVLIGPEGDFHPDELELAMDAGFKKTSLGLYRLRTETAALSVCTIFNFINS
jgi:16S rRNA (uracil1498-N3)-methyltransferase